MNYYLVQDDQARGPYTIGQLRSMWNSGVITAETLHCQEGDESWKPLRAIILELEPPPIASPTPPQALPTFTVQQPARPKRGVGAALGCFIIVVAAIVIAIGSSVYTKPASAHKFLKASISADRDTLTIVNNDDFTWENVHVYINDSTYKAQFAVLYAGRRKVLSLTEFANDSGERFSSVEMKVVDVWIGGGGYDFKKYGCSWGGKREGLQ